MSSVSVRYLDNLSRLTLLTLTEVDHSANFLYNCENINYFADA